MEKLFKIGDIVFYTDKFNIPHKGRVVEDYGKPNDPTLVVSFENDTRLTFYQNGASIKTAVFGRISFEPYEYVLDGYSTERPVPRFSKGEVVFVRLTEYSEWKIVYYSHYCAVRKCHYCYNKQGKTGRTTGYFYAQKENPLI